MNTFTPAAGDRLSRSPLLQHRCLITTRPNNNTGHRLQPPLHTQSKTHLLPNLGGERHSPVICDIDGCPVDKRRVVRVALRGHKHEQAET